MNPLKPISQGETLGKVLTGDIRADELNGLLVSQIAKGQEAQIRAGYGKGTTILRPVPRQVVPRPLAPDLTIPKPIETPPEPPVRVPEEIHVRP